MPPQGVLLNSRGANIEEVPHNDNCDATDIESDDNSDGTEMEFDNQSDENENWEDIVDDEENSTQQANHETLERGTAFRDDPPLESIYKPKMFRKQPTTVNNSQISERPLGTEAVRKRISHSSRRSHERVDGLQHLLPSSAIMPENEVNEMQPLNGIAFCLIFLNLKVLEARDFDHQIKNSELYSTSESSYMDGIVTEAELKRWHPTPESSMDSAQENQLANEVKTFSKEQIIQRIRDPKALPFISKLFEHEMRGFEPWKWQKRMVETDPDWVVPLDNDAKSKSDYINACVGQYRTWRQSLRDLYNLTLQLREHVINACSSNLLDESTLRQLKAKMAALQPGFREAGYELLLPMETLVWDSQTWWLDPQTAEPPNQFLDSKPRNVVTAFPPVLNNNTNSALAFLVPVLSLLSCIPTALSWTHSAHQTGTISDADFFQLIANSAMQLLGNLTLTIPTISNARLVGHAWFWTWILAGTSTTCAIAAIPLYLNAPTEWSGAVSFAGNVMQAFVTLQLMFAI